MAAAAVLPATTNFRIEDPGREPPPARTEKAAPTAEQFESLQRELSEVRESARVWEGIANNRPQPVRRDTEDKPQATATDIDWGDDKEPDAEPDDVTAEALLDDLSKTGLGALKKHGFVRRSEVVRIAREESRKAAATASTQVVNRARTELTVEQRQSQIMQEEFPDLSDTNSELYKLTARNLQDAVALDPKSAKSGATLILAARAAKATLTGKPVNRTRQTQQEEVDDEPGHETPPRRTQRQEQIAAQHGDRGTRTRSRVDTGVDDDPGMTDDELAFANAIGVKPADFKANQKALLKASGRGKR